MVRDYARRLGLPVAEKPDSQEICFIPDHDYAAFVSSRAPDAVQPGVIVDERGRVLGGHEGIHRFTVGQRKGLGLATSPDGAPMYVLAVRAADRQVVVGPKASLERTTLTASGVNWILEEPVAPIRVDRADPASPSGRARRGPLAWRRGGRSRVRHAADRHHSRAGRGLLRRRHRRRRRLDRLRLFDVVDSASVDSLHKRQLTIDNSLNRPSSPLVDHAILHHEQHASQSSNVLRRIASHGDQIGEQALLHAVRHRGAGSGRPRLSRS